MKRLNQIALDALAVVIEDADVGQRSGVPLVGSFVVPVQRLGVVDWNALADVIHDCKVELRAGNALFGGFAVPFFRLRVILKTTGPFVI